MKFYKKSSKKEGKQYMPTYTVGSALRGGDVPACSDKERRMRQIEASVRMNRNKLGRIFSPFTREQLKSPEILKPNKDDEL